MEQISFPGLGIEFMLDRVAFYLPEFLGSYPIYWYGVLIATGFLLAVLYILKKASVFGLDSDRAFDVTFITIILGVIGARAYYIAFSWEDYNDGIWSIINIRGGGLAIYGGIIFGILGICLGCKLRKVKLLPMIDLTVGGVLIGQAIGRWGNFFNMEAFGGNTSLPWGMTSPSIQNYLTSNQEALTKIGMTINPSQPVHPTFLYESLWCVLGFIVICLLNKKRRFDGQITLTYLAWYGFGRFFIEGLRTDSLMAGNIRVSQGLALLCFIVSSLLLVFILNKVKKSDNPEYLKLYSETEEAQLIRDGKFYKKSGKDDEISEDKEEDESEKVAASTLEGSDETLEEKSIVVDENISLNEKENFEEK